MCIEMVTEYTPNDHNPKGDSYIHTLSYVFIYTYKLATGFMQVCPGR